MRSLHTHTHTQNMAIDLWTRVNSSRQRNICTFFLILLHYNALGFFCGGVLELFQSLFHKRSCEKFSTLTGPPKTTSFPTEFGENDHTALK